jgi:uncharacterized sporulation protein YeaH/YhbH (DUF444 family)
MWAANALSFLLGPSGRIILLVVAFAGWTIYQRYDATRDCNEAHATAELKEAKRQAELSREIAEEARKEADQAQSEIEELEARNAQLREDIQSLPTAGCAIPPDIADRLRNIR